MKASRNRRELLGSLAAGVTLANAHLLATDDGFSTQHTSAESGSLGSLNTLLQRENQRPGTTEWLLDNTRIDSTTKYRSPTVEGYASHASILPGETLQLMISSNPAAEVACDIYRLGYYGGKGGRLIKQLGLFHCDAQPDPQPGTRRLMNCDWQATTSIEIESDWPSGVYVVKLTESTEQIQSYIIFVVRDVRNADLVYQVSDHTWQAYNRWPNQYSLYDDGQNQWHWGGKSQVSFNRPYGKYCQIIDTPLSIGSGDFFLWEFPFVFWLEMKGYDVTYISNTDNHRDPQTVKRGKGFLSVGHDEYWTIEMFQNAQAAIQAGTSIGFFSGNAVCGKILWDEETRSFHRVGVFGPPGGMRDFESMSSLAHEPPYANELIGAHSTGPVTGGADWICTRPEHWIYEGTGMKLGDRIEGLIGWEYHGDPAQIPGLEIVAEGPTQSAPGQLNGGHYTATVYPGPKGNIVFNAATCWWADGLSAPPGYQSPSVYASPRGMDSRVQKITQNILDRMIGGSA